VADRPPHLRACLESIYQVCALFDYGGHASGMWDRIRVVVAEDSRDEANVRRHQELVEEYRQKGLQVVHFGLAEQYELLHALPRSSASAWVICSPASRRIASISRVRPPTATSAI
jgi:hypothetical protein